MQERSSADKYAFIFGIVPIILSILIFFAAFTIGDTIPFLIFWSLGVLIIGVIGVFFGNFIGAKKDRALEYTKS